MGSETEFGILGGWTIEAATAIQQCVEARHPHVAATKEGVFLEAGFRAYVDVHCHNEIATPEVEDPLQLVRYELAGRELLRRAAAECGHVLVCSNLHYGSGNTWGTHENYELRSPLNDPASDVMLSHLATRIALAGAGGPHPSLPGMKLIMSPRAAVTRAPHESQGVLTKSMLYRKPDQYGAGQRLHVFCGESLLCPRASWLKYGTTALVALCLDSRLIQPGHLTLQNPLRTMHTFNVDTEFSSRFAMSDGTRLTGLEVQRRLLDAVEAHRAALPAWAGDVLGAWRAMLRALETHDAQLSSCVDWLLYRRLWHQLAEEHGFAAADLPRVQSQYQDGLGERERERYERLCESARELYVRLHAMHGASPWAAVDAAGWLEPALPGLGPAQIERAIETAPPGRAANRARLIRELKGGGAYAMNWNRVDDLEQSRTAAIPHDPEWAGEPQWESNELAWYLPPAEPDMEVRVFGMVAAHEPCQSFRRAFRTGDYDDALRAIAAAGTERAGDDPVSVAVSHARMGRRSEAWRVLDACPELQTRDFMNAATRLFCSVNHGLVPPLSECLPWVREGERLLAESGDDSTDSGYNRVVFDQSRAWVWLHEGRFDEAIALFQATAWTLRQDWRPRMLARTACFLAEALRRIGRPLEAKATLVLPARIYLNEALAGDAADHYLPVIAKLGDPELAEPALRCAEALHRRRGHGLSLARTLCLHARIARNGSALPEVRSLAQHVEALRNCERMQAVLADWSNWVEGDRAEGTDEYWGL